MANVQKRNGKRELHGQGSGVSTLQGCGWDLWMQPCVHTETAQSGEWAGEGRIEDVHIARGAL